MLVQFLSIALSKNRKVCEVNEYAVGSCTIFSAINSFFVVW